MKLSGAVHPSTDKIEDIRKEYDRMMYVIKALGGGIWDFDAASGAISCNRRWHEILGLDYDIQRVSTIEQFRKHIHPDDVERATKVDLDEVRHLIAQDERYSIEFRIIHQDGKPRWIRSVASLVAGPDGSLRAIGCITNITPLVAPQLSSRGKTPSEESAYVSPGRNAGKIKLSDREVECLRWASFGKTAKETAVILGKSSRTIEFHLNKAMKKLGAVNKVQAAFLAIDQNLI